MGSSNNMAFNTFRVKKKMEKTLFHSRRKFFFLFLEKCFYVFWFGHSKPIPSTSNWRFSQFHEQDDWFFCYQNVKMKKEKEKETLAFEQSELSTPVAYKTAPSVHGFKERQKKYSLSNQSNNRWFINRLCMQHASTETSSLNCYAVE